MPGFFIEERCPKTFEGIPKRPKVLKTSKIRDFVIKGMECQFSKNVGLGKFLPNLEIPEAFVVGLKVSFSGYSLSWRLEDFEVSVSNFFVQGLAKSRIYPWYKYELYSREVLLSYFDSSSCYLVMFQKCSNVVIISQMFLPSKRNWSTSF